MTIDWDTEKAIKDVRTASLMGVANGIEAIRANALNKILTGPKTGRLYKRRSVVHQASAPGEAPANDRGRLAQSARTDLDPEKIVGTLTCSTAYAAALEFGRDDGRILARPYARPALEEEREGIEKAIGKEVRITLT